MGHIKEHKIELFVLSPGTIDDPERQILEAHLSGCPSCRGVEQYLRSFYEDLQNVPAVSSSRLEAFAQRVSLPSNAIPLHPYKHQLKPGIVDSHYITVLAAQSPADSAFRFQPVAVLTSDDQNVILRVLRDVDKGTFTVYVLTSEPEMRNKVVVSFPDLYADVTTDELGRAELRLTEDLIPKDWRAIQAYIRVPVS